MNSCWKHLQSGGGRGPGWEVPAGVRADRTCQQTGQRGEGRSQADSKAVGVSKGGTELPLRGPGSAAGEAWGPHRSPPHGGQEAGQAPGQGGVACRVIPEWGPARWGTRGLVVRRRPYLTSRPRRDKRTGVLGAAAENVPRTGVAAGGWGRVRQDQLRPWWPLRGRP